MRKEEVTTLALNKVRRWSVWIISLELAAKTTTMF